MSFVAMEGQERSVKVMGCQSRSLESTCQQFQGPHSWHHLVHSLNTFSKGGGGGGEEKETTIKYWHKKSNHNVIIKLSNTVLTSLLCPPQKTTTTKTTTTTHTKKPRMKHRYHFVQEIEQRGLCPSPRGPTFHIQVLS